MEPSASLRLVKFRWYLETKFCIASTSECAATPTKVTPGLAAATRLTLGASALQNGQNGAQNHSTAGLPCRLAPLNGAPLRVVPVNCSRSSAASARGALPTPTISAAATSTAANALFRADKRILMAHLNLAELCPTRRDRPPSGSPALGGQLSTAVPNRLRSSYPPSAASCPQAALISRPRVSRTVQETPLARTRRTNSRSTPLGLASHSLPGVGLRGIRFTCTNGPSARCSRWPKRSARQGWSLTSRINASSTDTRRPVTSA